MIEFGWPQWGAIVFLFLHLLVHASQTGKPMLTRDKVPMEYNVFVATLRVSVWVALLYFGGFFS